MAVLSCHHDRIDNGSCPNCVYPPPGARAEFTVVPMEVPNGTLTPLGSLNPPGHTLPTDHVYFYPWNLDTPFAPRDTLRRTVIAPAAGTVNFILQPPGSDGKVQFIVTPTFQYYIDHVVLKPGIVIGTVVHPGDTLGTTLPGYTLDLGAIDSLVTNTGFARPQRYGYFDVHAVSPWKYFVEPLRSQLYARIRRAPGVADKDGKIDFDIPGRLVGGWFEQGLADTASWEPSGWPRTVAFVFDYYDPSQVRIAVGGTIGPAGVWGIESTAPRPENVSVTTGKVIYKLYSPFDPGFPPQGVLIVQMISDAQIRIEMFTGAGVTATDFDAQAKTFVR